MKAYIIYKQWFDPLGKKRMIGGIETYLINLAEILKARGIEPEIIQSSNTNFSKDIRGITIRGYNVRKGKRLYRRLYNQVKKRLKDEDIIIWGLERTSVKVSHRRTISIQHGIPFDYYQEEALFRRILLKIGLGHFLKRVQRIRAIKAFKKSSIKVCVDYNFWNWYRTFCLPTEEENIFIIPNFSRLPHKRVSPRNFSTDSPLKILFARRFVRMRGVENFIEVAEHYKNDGRVEITFAGEGPYEQKIRTLVQRSENIHITKYESENSVDFCKDFDVSVVPSIASEGTSLSLLEAMSVGNVVISTCVGGMTNIVLDGFNGFFVKPNAPKQIIEKIEAILDNRPLMWEISRNATMTIEKTFSFDIWKQKWDKVIDLACEL